MPVTTDDFDGQGTTNSSAGSTLIDLSPVGPKALAVDQQTVVGDTTYQMLPTDRYVVTNAALTTSRLWTLPAANSVSQGWQILIADQAGGITSANQLQITTSGSDTLNGAAFQIQLLNYPYAFAVVRSDGISKWLAIGNYPAIAIGGTPDGNFVNVDASGWLATSATASTAANGRNDNFAATGTYTRIAGPSAAFSFSGFLLPTGSFTTNGLVLNLTNTTSFPMTLLHQSGFSTAANRIVSPTAASVVVQGGGSCSLIYDSGQSRWVVKSVLNSPNPQSLRENKSFGGNYETFPRASCAAVNTVGALTSGTLYCVAVDLPNNLLVTNITFVSGATAAGTPVNWWFALLTAAGSPVLLGQTADQTTTAWAANTSKTVALTTPYTITVEGVYYVAVMVKATTVPTLTGFVTTANLTNLAGGAKREGNSTTGLTTPASLTSPATALTVTGNIAYAYTS